MNCIKCYQEIPEGSKFCPYCGAEQAAAPAAGAENVQPAQEVQPEINAQAEAPTEPETTAQVEAPAEPETTAQAEAPAEPETTAQAEAPVKPEPETQYGGTQNTVPGQTGANQQYQEAPNYNAGYQGGYSYGNGSPNGTYQTPPSCQQEPEINWVPYLVLSIISTVCCCIPAGIVAIVFSSKINSEVSAGNIEAARKAAKMAKIWIIVSVVAGALAIILYAIFLAVVGTGTYYYY